MWDGVLRRDQLCRTVGMAAFSATRAGRVNSRSGARHHAEPFLDLFAADVAVGIPWHGDDPLLFASCFGSCTAPFFDERCRGGGCISQRPADDLRAVSPFLPSGHRDVFCDESSREHKAENIARACTHGTSRLGSSASGEAVLVASGYATRAHELSGQSVSAYRPCDTRDNRADSRPRVHRGCLDAGRTRLLASSDRIAGSASLFHTGV